MSTAYRAYAPSAFTDSERDKVTILFGGVHWRLERVLEGLFENLRYRAKALPPASREDLQKGRELADIGQCCPTTFTTGNLANFLLKEKTRSGGDAVVKDYVYLTAGSCGACRFGQYHQSYELALRNIGLESFRIYMLAQDRVEQGSTHGGGLQLNIPLTVGAVFAALCTDVLRDIEYQIRPYEVSPGATAKAARAAVEDIHDAFRERPWRGEKWGALTWHLTTGYFADALKRARRHFEDIKVDRLRIKPKVAVTGEFYLQTAEGPANYNIFQWLEAEGAEIYPPTIAAWLDYNIRFYGQVFEDYQGIDRLAGAKLAGMKMMSGLLHMAYGKLRRALGNLPRALPNQYELRRLAGPYYNSRLSGGEGDMLIGKALWVHLNRKAHMICELSPYGCMPNTMSIGAMSGVLGKHPDLLYAPLEIKGDAEIHALSRCQMILTEARKRARQEYETALAVTGLTTEKAQAMLDARPEMKRALYAVPHFGAAGTAANMVLALGGKRL